MLMRNPGPVKAHSLLRLKPGWGAAAGQSCSHPSPQLISPLHPRPQPCAGVFRAPGTFLPLALRSELLLPSPSPLAAVPRAARFHIPPPMPPRDGLDSDLQRGPEAVRSRSSVGSYCPNPFSAPFLAGELQFFSLFYPLGSDGDGG